MTIPFYHIDTFTTELFGGNPAGVCPLDAWLEDALMQRIAAENNVPATAFFVPIADVFHIRWFSPTAELALCGHGTLAASFVLFNHLNYHSDTIRFTSQAGDLLVRRNGEWISVELQADFVQPIEFTETMLASFNLKPIEAHRGGRDLMLLFRTQDEIEQAVPDIDTILKLDTRGVMITARGLDVDFVSRFFAPRAGILEDPVTGSAHASLVPYWSQQLGKQALEARQLSSRGGYLKCELKDDKVLIAGQAVEFSRGEIIL